LDEGQRNRCRHVLNVPQIMEEFNVSKSTAYEWKKS
jgi:transposase